MFRMVKKMQNSGLEIVAGLTLPLNLPQGVCGIQIELSNVLLLAGHIGLFIYF